MPAKNNFKNIILIYLGPWSCVAKYKGVQPADRMQKSLCVACQSIFDL